RANRRALFAIAWGILRERGLAEDAVHAAFIGLLELRAPPQNPRPYAFRAVRNAALNLLASQQRRRESPLGAIELPAAAGDGRNGEALGRAAEAALAELNAGDREAVELHLRAGLTFAEIGELLDEPMSTVASRYRRAIAKLRERIVVPDE
ncbi:MAG TPA: sigma-70 family RNA polymerase sigma factor, partial [Pirellulales bacterium]|nr:sigma-70 family RNA polymerase sigma factor [Pirellulales bacterium]